MDDYDLKKEKYKPKNYSLPERVQSPDVANMDSEEEEEYPVILNVQKAMYEVILADLQRKIERLQVRNEELEQHCDMVKNNSGSVDKESEVAIVQLGSNIDYTATRIDETKKKIDQIEEIRETDKSRHLKRVKQLEDNFEKTRVQMYSQVKEINARINKVNEFKNVDQSLRKKLEGLIKVYMLKEEEVETILAQFNFKSMIHKENLKKESYQQILDTSVNFKHEVTETITPAVKRLMRENIVLANELNLLRSDRIDMKDEQLKQIDKIHEYRSVIKEAKANHKSRLITCKIQSSLIKKLQSLRSKVKSDLLKAFMSPKNVEQVYSLALENGKSKVCLTNEYRVRKLEVILHQERVKLSLAESLKAKTLSALKKVSDTLICLKTAVKSAWKAYKYNEKGESKDASLESFAHYLLNIIYDCECKKWIDSVSLETVAGPENAYMIGDLGFEPRHIEVFKSYKVIEKVPSRSILSTPAVLKELEELAAVTVSQEERQDAPIQRSFHISTSSDRTSSLGSMIDRKISLKETAGGLGKPDEPSSEDEYEYEEDFSRSEYDIE